MSEASPARPSVRSSSLSRRGFLGGVAVGAGVTALQLTGGLDPQSAAAAVAWNHPFTRRTSITANGDYLNYAPFRQQLGLSKHTGIDLNASANEVIYNCAPGTVTFAGTSTSAKSYGYHVRVLHED